MLRRETLVCDTIEEETGIAIKKEGTPEPPASSKPNWSSPNPQVAEFERQKLVIPFRPDQPEGFDLRIGQFVGQSDRHLGQPEFAGGFKPEMPVNNRAVRFGHDRNPEPEFPNSGGHLINLGVILARIARVFNRPIDRPLLDLQWTCHAAAVSFIESI